MNPSRRRFWFVSAVVLSLLIGAAVAYHLWTRCPIRYDNFAQIANGMHLNEVEKLLGCPAGDYRRAHIEYALDDLHFPLDNEEARWQGDQGDLMIFHDHNKLVVGKSWMKGEPEPWLKTGMIWFVERIPGEVTFMPRSVMVELPSTRLEISYASDVEHFE